MEVLARVWAVLPRARELTLAMTLVNPRGFHNEDATLGRLSVLREVDVDGHDVGDRGQVVDLLVAGPELHVISTAGHYRASDLGAVSVHVHAFSVACIVWHGTHFIRLSHIKSVTWYDGQVHL